MIQTSSYVNCLVCQLLGTKIVLGHGLKKSQPQVLLLSPSLESDEIKKNKQTNKQTNKNPHTQRIIQKKTKTHTPLKNQTKKRRKR